MLSAFSRRAIKVHLPLKQKDQWVKFKFVCPFAHKCLFDKKLPCFLKFHLCFSSTWYTTGNRTEAHNIRTVSNFCREKQWLQLQEEIGAILQKKSCWSESVNPASVRRFASFGLLLAKSLPQKSVYDEHRWSKYTCTHHEDFSVDVRHLSINLSVEELIGFNNTGNVCVWPAEEVLTSHCIKHAESFRNARVCELGGGMTCLAGIAVAACSDAVEVLLTDGNETSVKNVHEILAANNSKFGKTSITERELKWNKRESFEDLKGHFDHVIAADCLFFDEFRPDLVDTIDFLLQPKGVATIFAPHRGDTLKNFCQLARTRFTVNTDNRYDELVWQKHREMLIRGSDEYDENIHYPIKITLTR